MANLSGLQAQSLLQAVFEAYADLDVVLIDMAAGLSESGLAFLRACDLKVVVVQDEPASLADAYGLIKLQKRENRMNDIVLLPNRVPSEAEGRRLFDKLNSVCMKFLEEPVRYIQSVEEDRLILETGEIKEKPIFNPSSI